MPSFRLVKWIIIESIAIGLIASYFLIDVKTFYQWWVGTTHFTMAEPSCNLHENSCDVTLIDGTLLRLEIDPKPIALMKPLHFKVTTKATLPSLEIKLFATNMNMGLHTIKLIPTTSGVYEGEGMLPTCLNGNMIWQTNVILNQSHKSIGASFTFQTTR